MGNCGSDTSAKPAGNKPSPNGIESELVDKPKPLPSDDPGLIDVINVDLNIPKNTEEHHTDQFEITDKLDGDNRENLVIRRGQKFTIKIEFNREYYKDKDDLRLVFQFGKRPLPSKGTHVEFILSDRDVPNKWGAYIQSKDSNSINLIVLTPPSSLVGKWKMHIDVVKRHDSGTTVFRYTHKDPIYLLFNPWCEDDQVYMHEKGEKLLDEYVLNDTGKIYSGSYSRISPKPWVFGQFTGIVLDCILYLLDTSTMKDHRRGDPVLVSRKLSALINSSDDNGVLTGNWSGNYSGGTSPLKWAGSVAILTEYYGSKRPVRYGQCWVFSGVLTTACRALGIPARSVTNFSSAHDTDGSVTIDKHFDHRGDEIDHLSGDSVWNFHVWNDVWMARPDLKGDNEQFGLYGGWQAIDATPQETSEGVYCMGPMSLEATKRGNVDLPYDGRFVFAEVNADRVHWVHDEYGGKTVSSIKQHSVGKNISTKRPLGRASWRNYLTLGDPDREDVTNQYKFPEGSEEERAAVRKANMQTSVGTVYKIESKDVTFELVTNPDTYMGGTINESLKITNASTEDRTINGTFKLNSMYYTGNAHKLIEKREIDRLKLKANEEKLVTIEIPPKDYLDKLMDHCMIKISCMCLVKETKQLFSEIEELRLRKPHLDIEAPDTGRVGEKFKVKVSFDNPLHVALSKCELRVEGPGLQRPVTYPQNNVDAHKQFVGTFEMTPMKHGEREIIVYFNCTQIDSVNSSHVIKVQKK